jgi:hypothetical protein
MMHTVQGMMHRVEGMILSAKLPTFPWFLRALLVFGRLFQHESWPVPQWIWTWLQLLATSWQVPGSLHVVSLCSERLFWCLIQVLKPNAQCTILNMI